jgi:hypothetical protein
MTATAASRVSTTISLDARPDAVVADAIVDLGWLVLRFGRTYRITLHDDGTTPECCATLKITTGGAFTMPTTIPANRTAGSVKCRPSSARRRERPVVCTPQRASRAPRGGS